MQEAKLTELITLVTNYSCGEEGCSTESGGLPLDWAEYREPGTQFIKASTSPNSIAKQLTKVFNFKSPRKREQEKKSREFVINNYSIEKIGQRLEELFDSMPFCDWDFDFTDTPQNPEYNPPEISDNGSWLKDLYANILNRPEVDERDDGHKHWMNQIKQGRSRNEILAYFKQVAAQHNSQISNQVSFEDLLDKDDKGSRLLVIVQKNETDILHATSLLPSLKTLYPKYNIYFATDVQYFELLDGNPDIHKVIPYTPQMENLLFLEGSSGNSGHFEVAFNPTIGSQKFLAYPHNSKDNIYYDLCM